MDWSVANKMWMHTARGDDEKVAQHPTTTTTTTTTAPKNPWKNQNQN
jgi:hypothetical protein